MPRYQFEPRANTASVDTERAKQSALKHGAKRVLEAFPTCYTLDISNKPTREWVGTNQPRTIKFSAETDSQAAAICKEYGNHFVQVWNITSRNYV